ncbi:MAG: dienelactone hydrolase family protein [Bacteroidales bacterium]|nr:dienelactone hydrolase family protein [Bacteroidales bacterium]
MRPRKQVTWICVFISVVLFISLPKQGFALPDGYRDCYIDSFRYGLFIPPNYDPAVKYHLILYLHGYTDTTSWNFQWYRDEFQAIYPTLVLSPKCLIGYTDRWGNSWDMKESFAMKMAFRALDSTLKYYNIDTTRMHVCGTSMGGFGTFYVLARYPGMFASAYAVCGGGNPVTASLLKDTPLWIFHGEIDPVVPVSQSRNIYAAILKAGGTLVRYSEYPGFAHNSWENAGREKTLDPWLFAQQLGSVHGSPDSAILFICSINESHMPELKWEAPADQSIVDKEVWCYRIYRDSKLIATLDKDSLHYTDSTVKLNQNYRYSIRAVNYFFKESPASNEISVILHKSAAENSFFFENYHFFIPLFT